MIIIIIMGKMIKPDFLMNQIGSRIVKNIKTIITIPVPVINLTIKIDLNRSIFYTQLSPSSSLMKPSMKSFARICVGS